MLEWIDEADLADRRWTRQAVPPGAINPRDGKVTVTEAYPEKYLEGIRLFNDEEFFECHDVLEELWSETLGEEKKFLQGLIQASVALFHFGNENLGGARKLCDSSIQKLEPYGPAYMGLNLEKFLKDFRFCFEELMSATNGYPQGIELIDERVPRMETEFELPESTADPAP